MIHTDGVSAAAVTTPTRGDEGLVAAPTAMDVAELAVAVADVCGFTTFSRFADLPHLDIVLRSFDQVCAVALGDRAEMVRATGDGVLYAMPTAEDAVVAAVDLVAAARESMELPPVRVGLAFGTVLRRGLDCFGPTVDLAGHLAATAPPGAVVLSEAAHAETRARWSPWRRLPPRELEGMGSVPAWEVAWAI